MRNSEIEKYYVLDGPIYETTPPKIKKYLDRILTKDEWKRAGFPIIEDQYGNIKSFTENGLYFGHSRILSNGKSEDELESLLSAAKSGLRITKSAYSIWLYVHVGIDRKEFIFMNDSINFYLDAKELADKKMFLEALETLEKALSINPSEYSYQEFQSDLYFQSDSLSKYPEVLNFYKNNSGISSMIHSGRAEKWVKRLFKFKLFEDVIKLRCRISDEIKIELVRKEKSKRIENPMIKSAMYINGIEQDWNDVDKRSEDNRLTFVERCHDKFEEKCKKQFAESLNKIGV